MLGIRRAGRRIADVVDVAYAHAAAPRATLPPQRVLVVGVYKEPGQILHLVEELQSWTHDVDVRLGSMGEAAPALSAWTVAADMREGKFQNINRLLPNDLGPYDWMLIVDDDVSAPRGFLPTMLEIASRLDLSLAQPAQSRFSNANWQITRRRLFTVARETSFVEIGPVTLLRADAMKLLLPFPADLRWGWGLDFHWAHVMTQRSLRMGIIDAATVVHASRRVASTYSWDAAQEEGRAFLAEVGHLPPSVARGAGNRRHRFIR